MPQLTTPHIRFRASFAGAMKEFEAEGRGAVGDDTSIGQDLRRWRRRWHDPAVFASYVAGLRAEADETIPMIRPGWVHCTTLWYVDGDAYLGRIAIRHSLTGWLRDQGGHIGYDVRPTARRRGHATAMLRDALPVARGLGLAEVLVTCDHDNVASRKVIEANGGVFEDRRGLKLRYWVATAEAKE
ncbi:GNAT family N-acetyltransferase [Streptomyces sp. CMB-StM0423]|uniref:GNAT family N-acetyltransferase n=1 Tax=Streptomyces sp. CMB-StM0423 TaxID=2059884 RepID=UPI001F1B02DA|nr:GNAT family N-acetyltransferase [Streptomyces sp. CMB-StM0423]